MGSFAWQLGGVRKAHFVPPPLSSTAEGCSVRQDGGATHGVTAATFAHTVSVSCSAMLPNCDVDFCRFEPALILVNIVQTLG